MARFNLYRSSVWMARVLPFVAMGISAYLTWISLTGKTAFGCTGQSGCDEVLHGSWARWMGVPVAAVGLLVYTTLAAMSWVIGAPRAPRGLPAILIFLVTLAAGAGIWFFVVQYFILGQFCVYCSCVHACGLMLAGILAYHRAAGPPANASEGSLKGEGSQSPAASKPFALPAVALGLLGVAGLMLGQIVAPASNIVELDSDQIGRDFEQVDLTEIETPLEGESSTLSPAAADDARAVPHLAAKPPIQDVIATARETQTSSELAVPDEPNQATNDELPSKTASDTPSDASLEDLLNSLDEMVLPKQLVFFGGRLKLQTDQHPIIGPVDAEQTVVEFFDYTCKGCRKLHRILKESKHEFPESVSFLLLPTPLHPDCNPAVDTEKVSDTHKYACKLGRLGVAVWRVAPDRFAEFHNWMMEGETAPTLDDALNHAVTIVDPLRLKAAVNDAQVTDRIKLYCQVYAAMRRQNDKVGLPIQLLGNRPVVGVPDTREEAVQLYRDFFAGRAGKATPPDPAGSGP